MHFVNAAVGFFARFLYHDCPIERGDRTIRPQHFGFCLAIADGKFAGGCQLRFCAIVHKAADNIVAGHVLPGSGKFRRGRCYQASLGVHNVRCEPGAVHFLQTPDEELQIHDTSDHAQEAITIYDRSAHQQHRPSGFAAAHHQRLTTVAAFLMGGRVGAFQFALQECVWFNSSRRNAFSIDVQYAGIGNVVRG